MHITTLDSTRKLAINGEVQNRRAAEGAACQRCVRRVAGLLFLSSHSRATAGIARSEPRSGFDYLPPPQGWR